MENTEQFSEFREFMEGDRYYLTLTNQPVVMAKWFRGARYDFGEFWESYVVFPAPLRRAR